MDKSIRRGSFVRQLTHLSASALALAGIAYVDLLSGPEIGVSLFYLVPVLAAALTGDRLTGPLVAVMAAVTWYLADLSGGHAYSIDWAPLWNSFTRLVYFLGSVLLVQAYRAKREAEEALQRLNAKLEQRVQERTTELLELNRELESFNQSIAHDLRTPLRGIDGFSQVLHSDYAHRLDETGKQYLRRISAAASRMGELIDALLSLSQLTRRELRLTTVDVSKIASELAAELRQLEPNRLVDFNIAPRMKAVGDHGLLRMALANLLDNAWKFSRDTRLVEITVGYESKGGETVFYVRDNGTGFDSAHAQKLFLPFQRLHLPGEFDGVGVGLATVASIVRLHGGSIWANSEPGRGATFRFTLGKPASTSKLAAVTAATRSDVGSDAPLVTGDLRRA